MWGLLIHLSKIVKVKCEIYPKWQYDYMRHLIMDRGVVFFAIILSCFALSSFVGV